MIPEVTIGAAVLMAALILATGAARWYFRPAPTVGQHRAGMVRPVEALNQFEAWCLAEHRRTLHVQLATGTVCLDCRTALTGGQQAGGVR
ncbi:hypothetical protein [Streptomyces sp. NPDC047028]|uniref:hypothetical protein n=1 Tax=Streptomyces sp. NPDC047028 TaxID=3155793 RepID=UPI0033DA2D24